MYDTTKNNRWKNLRLKIIVLNTKNHRACETVCVVYVEWNRVAYNEAWGKITNVELRIVYSNLHVKNQKEFDKNRIDI